MLLLYIIYNHYQTESHGGQHRSRLSVEVISLDSDGPPGVHDGQW